MKRSLERNFSVSVRHQVLEERPEVAELYQGIYSVTLNSLVTVMFVPEFKRNAKSWPPALSENVDNVNTEQEARLFTTALSDYTITPDRYLAGQEEVIPQASVTEDNRYNRNFETRTIFYVTHQEFDTFVQELSVLAEQMLGIHDYVRISEIENLKFAQLILARVINSKHFSLKDLKILGREYKYAKL